MHIVFIVRGAKRRRILNADALAAACAKAPLGSNYEAGGVISIKTQCSTYPFGSDWARDLHLLRSTDILVGAHGGDLINGLAMRQ